MSSDQTESPDQSEQIGTNAPAETKTEEAPMTAAKEETPSSEEVEKKADEEAKAAAEVETLKKAQEEAKAAEEAEAAKKAEEEAKAAAETEAAKKAEEEAEAAKALAEAEAAKKAEEETEAAKKAEEEAKAAAEAAKKAEEEAEAAKKAEEEAKAAAEAEAAKKAEEEAKAAEDAEAAKKAEEEAKAAAKIAAAKKAAEEAEAAKRAEEEAKAAAEADATKNAEVEAKAAEEADAAKKAEEDVKDAAEREATKKVAVITVASKRSNVPTPTVEESSAGKPRPIVFAGPSGAGKGTLISSLMKRYPDDQFGFSVSHTTRSPREGEINGLHYNFTTVEKMKAEIDAGKFIEYAEVHGNYYGTSVEAVKSVQSKGQVCILDIDVQGVQNVKKSTLNPYYIFIAPPSMDDLEARLRGRGTEKEEDITKRLANAKGEMDYGKEPGNFDKYLINGDLSAASADLNATIKSWYPHLSAELAEGGNAFVKQCASSCVIS